MISFVFVLAGRVSGFPCQPPKIAEASDHSHSSPKPSVHKALLPPESFLIYPLPISPAKCPALRESGAQSYQSKFIS